MSKIYCNDCRHHIPRIGSLIGYRKHNEYNPDNGEDICGKSLSYEKHPTGRTYLKCETTTERCDECKQIVKQKGRIVYTKCIIRNKNYDCSDYEQKTSYDKAVIFFSYLWNIISNYFKSIKISGLVIFVIWFISTAWLFVIKNYLYDFQNSAISVLYVIISITYFYYYLKKEDK